MVAFDALQGADLVVDRVYEGGSAGHAGDDPLSKLLPVGNQGGFRHSGSAERPKLLVLYTDGVQPDWPNLLDSVSGVYTYYGDQREPGKEIHDTSHKGNFILSRVFSWLDLGREGRLMVPPIFLFEKCPTEGSSRSVRFRGMLVPGTPDAGDGEDLVAVWRSTDGNRFQNYRARFTVLDLPLVRRSWIQSLEAGGCGVELVPDTFQIWRETGKIKALRAERTLEIRTKESQLPQTDADCEILAVVHAYFSDRPFAFEYFAADVYSMSDSNVIVDEVTRSVVDGGRDAVGRLRLGLQTDPVYVDFALEAKCYNPGLDSGRPNSVGVKEVSRLISRIRHRQFGVLVTTSVVAAQAYTEVREDRHPVVFFSGGDIVHVLKRAGYASLNEVRTLLSSY